MSYTLVTGASGFIGSHVCEKLVEKGYKVKALVRESSDKSFLDTLGVEYVYADLRDAKRLKEALEGVTTVFNCAAKVGVSDIFDKEHAEINIRGTRNLLEACIYNNVKKFIHFSTLGVLGIFRDHYNDDETAPYVKSGHPYYDTKIDSERLVLNYYNDRNLPVVVLRPGFVYGTRDRKGLKDLVPHTLKGDIVCVGYGNNDIALTSVNNLVQASMLALVNDNCIGRVYNITDGTGINMMQYITELYKILGIDTKVKKISIPTAKIISKSLNLIYGDPEKNPFNESVVAMVSNSSNFDISRAKKELGYKPVDNFEAELKESVEWYLNNNKKQINYAKFELRNKKIFKALSIASLAGLGVWYINNKISSNKK